MPFSNLGLSAFLARALAERAYDAPTPIQAAAIPAALDGRDVLGAAQTGSGKTLAFALPVLQRLQQNRRARSPRIQALVLVPTRELASQVGAEISNLARYLPEPPKIAVLFGGVSINPQMMDLRGGADIVVATPGRLLDLIDHNALSLAAASILVLDEADRLFDLGFADEVDRILDMLPAERQNLFFSATFAPAVKTLAEKILRDPVRVDVVPEAADAPDILQRAIQVDAGRRTQLLRHLVESLDWKQVLVFVASKYASEHVADKLRRVGIHAEPFHGELSQGKRTQVLQDFKAGRLQVVLATDLAARGLDIVQLPVVVNYDLPRSAVDYVHRIGRTGRAGESGVALSFISAATEAHFQLIEKRQRQHIPRERIAGFEPIDTAPAAQPGGGVKGKRPSKKDKLRAAAARDAE